jgi:ComF family protein
MSLKNFFLNCLFPQQCYGCKRSGTWLCLNCLNKIKRYQGQIPRHLNNIDKLIIAGEYSDPILQALIKAFKFNFNRELAIPLSVFLYRQINFLYLKDEYLIIPIPLHKQRFNWRGFNQSELIAREISHLSGWPLDLNLKKKKKTKEQANLKERERLNNQRDAFIWCGQSLREKNIMLLDDIITSGATISEAAKILKAAGADSVTALAVAKG